MAHHSVAGLRILKCQLNKLGIGCNCWSIQHKSHIHPSSSQTKSLQSMAKVSSKSIDLAIQDLARSSEAVVKVGQSDVKHGNNAMLYQPAATDKILPVAKAVEVGWIKAPSKIIKIDGHAGRKVVFPLLKRVSSLYTRAPAARSTHCVSSGCR